MSGFPGGHAGLLVSALATHALVGYTLGRVAVGRPWAGVLGGVVADLDLLVPAAWGWPLAHRGITHTGLAALVAVGVVVAVTRRRDLATAVGLGYASQLLLDATTPLGVALWYPLTRTAVTIPGNAHAPVPTLVLWVACVAVLAVDHRLGGLATPVTRGLR